MITISPTRQGKVRDIYELEDSLLFVATDRISAFDYILPSPITYKGEILTQITKFWFELFGDAVTNHMISCDVADLPQEFAPFADELAGRFMIVHKAEPLPVECIVRGYLTGSGKKEYDQTQTVCGIKLPEGLVEASKLDEPIFTPSTKAEIGTHDENISYERLVELVGEEDAAELKRLSIMLYTKARDYAATRGIIIADTKFEFGRINGKICLIDEALTPDSSRFWPADSYKPGKVQPSFDKQYVRDWLSANWDMTGEPPVLPQEVIDETSAKYQEAFKLLTGKEFVHVTA